MQAQQIVGSKPLLWELYNTGHSPRIPNNSKNEDEEGLCEEFKEVKEVRTEK